MRSLDMFDKMKHISDRAYYLWEQAGRPEGREQDFWLQAEAEYSSVSTTTVAPKRTRATKKTATKAAKKTTKKPAKKAAKNTKKK
jgi:hypothetical protein